MFLFIVSFNKVKRAFAFNRKSTQVFFSWQISLHYVCKGICEIFQVKVLPEVIKKNCRCFNTTYVKSYNSISYKTWLYGSLYNELQNCVRIFEN